MTEEQKRYDQIEAYLKGKMTAAEASQFEYRMLLDADLKQEVSVQKWALEALRLDYRDKLSDLIRERGREYKPANSNWKWWALGGLFLMGILAVGLFMFQNTDPVEQKIARLEKVNEPVKVIAQEKNPPISDQAGKLLEKPTKVITPVNTEGNFVGSVDTLRKFIDTVYVADHSIDTTQKLSTIPIGSLEEVHKTKIEQHDSMPVIHKVDDCLNPPKVDFEVTPAHKGYQDGTVSLFSNLEGELLFALLPFQEEFQSDRYINQVPAGKYLLKAKNGSCQFNLGSVEVPETICNPQKDYTFNVIFEQEFKLPIPDRVSGQVSIINKAGLEVFSRNFESGQQVLWNGFAQNGTDTQSGIHKLIVKTSQETCMYNVVVAK